MDTDFSTFQRWKRFFFVEKMFLKIWYVHTERHYKTKGRDRLRKKIQPRTVFAGWRRRMHDVREKDFIARSQTSFPHCSPFMLPDTGTRKYPQYLREKKIPGWDEAPSPFLLRTKIEFGYFYVKHINHRIQHFQKVRAIRFLSTEFVWMNNSIRNIFSPSIIQ